jgi:hypothetical protein
MKDHEIAELVNQLTKAVQPLCPAHQSLRQRISTVVTGFFREKKDMKKIDQTEK